MKRNTAQRQQPTLRANAKITLAHQTAVNHLQSEGEEQYIQPCSLKAHRYGLLYNFDGDYNGTGFLANRHKINPKIGKLQRCDISYMIKKSDQIAFEQKILEKKGSSAFYGINLNLIPFLKSMIQDQKAIIKNIEKRIEHQRKNFERIDQDLFGLYEEWGYESYKLCAYNELREVGYDHKAALGSHAIIFYHKRVLLTQV